MSKLKESALELIVGTPMLRLNRYRKHHCSKIMNHGGGSAEV